MIEWSRRDTSGCAEGVTEHNWANAINVFLFVCVYLRGMLRRPKPTDSEADLLREQQEFLTSGAPSAANVVRRPDKRRGEAGGGGGGVGGEPNGDNEGSQRDVVTIEGKRVY